MTFSERPTVRATALIALSSCSFGSLTTLTLLVMRSGLPLLPAMLWRYFLAALMLAVLLRQALTRITAAQAVRLIVVGGCGQAVITYLSLLALDYLPVGPLAFLFYTYPAWVACIAALTKTEELTWPRIMALAIAMTGIVIMVGLPSTGTMNRTGVLLALGTSVLYALYLPALHKVQTGIPPMTSTFYLIAGVFGSFFIASIVTGSLEPPQSKETWALVLGLALIGTLIAFSALIAGLRILGPVRTSIVSTIEPFFTALLGAFILGEHLTLATLAGGALIAIAVLLLQLNAQRIRRVESAT
jgi:drug/metabolite transporter (DMT)-like permease